MQQIVFPVLLDLLVNHQNGVHVNVGDYLNHVSSSNEVRSNGHKISYNWKVFLLSGYMNLSAELMEILRLFRSLNYYNEPGIYGVITLT